MVVAEPPTNHGGTLPKPLARASLEHDDAARVRAATDLVALVNEKVQLRRVGREWKGLCPFHEDQNPSLSVDPGRGLWHCFGCDLGGDAITWVEQVQHVDFRGAVALLLHRAGLPESEIAPEPRQRQTKQEPARVVANYDYVDAAGDLLYQVVRLEPKSFRQRRPDGRGGWVWGLGGVERVLFRLPEVLAAVEAGRPIYVVEGEKDAEALLAAGVTATTAAQGASSPWLEQYSLALQGASEVRVVADADAPGWARAKVVADALTDAGIPVRVLRAAEGKDAADHLAAGHGVDELVEVSTEELAELAGASPSPGSLAAGNGKAHLRVVDGDGHQGVRASARGFWADEHGLWRQSRTKDGLVLPVQLTTADIEILGSVIRDYGDGADCAVTWRLMVRCEGMQKEVEVDADMLGEPAKILHRSGLHGASVISRQGPYVVEAIHALSPSGQARVVYPHLGWREIDERWLYLHGAGAIGPEGPVEGIEVESPREGYGLPEPLGPEGLRDVVMGSLRCCLNASETVMAVLLGAAWRAVLPALPPTSLHVTGKTGIGKSATVAVALSCFGTGPKPFNWSGTANSLEEGAWALAGHICAIDDYVPTDDRQRNQLEATAERIFRNAANHLGRTRLRRDSKRQPERAPQAFIVSTGEDVPGGSSLSQRARVLVVELVEGEAPCGKAADPARTAALTAAQLAGREGQLAAITATYAAWLAGRIAEGGITRVRRSIEDAERELARKWSSTATHARTAPAIASLLVGWQWFLAWAQEAGALSQAEAQVVLDGVERYLGALAQMQVRHLAEADPVQAWVSHLQSALRSGRCHVAPRDDDTAQLDDTWGWQDGRAMGDRIGWLDDAGVYLVPGAAHAAVVRMARDSGSGWPWSPRITWERLLERGLIVRGDARHPYTQQLRFQGGRREFVIHVLPGILAVNANNEAPGHSA